MSTLKTTLCREEFDNCLMNASGCLCRTKEELFYLDESSSGGMVTKTSTYEPRNGNEEPRYWHNDNLSINSMGLPNEGVESYLSMSNFVSKPYFLSKCMPVIKILISKFEFKSFCITLLILPKSALVPVIKTIFFFKCPFF